jgi:uncharacterized membrane protein YesL
MWWWKQNSLSLVRNRIPAVNSTVSVSRTSSRETTKVVVVSSFLNSWKSPCVLGDCYWRAVRVSGAQFYLYLC